MSFCAAHPDRCHSKYFVILAPQSGGKRLNAVDMDHLRVRVQTTCDLYRLTFEGSAARVRVIQLINAPR